VDRVTRGRRRLDLRDPFVPSGGIGESPVMWSNVAAGIIAVVLAAYAGKRIHEAA
jgi:hypothetical protein